MRDIVLQPRDMCSNMDKGKPLESHFFQSVLQNQEKELLHHMRAWIRRRHESFALWPQKDQKKWITLNLSIDLQQWSNLVDIIEKGMTPHQIQVFHDSCKTGEKQLRDTLVVFFQNHLEYLQA